MKECLRCGYCCKQAPCSFGTRSASGVCVYLIGTQPGCYECDIAAEIKQQSGADISPAFGAGCCSPLNSDRKELEQ